MRITQLRNATVVIEAGERVILVDPMLAPKGAIPPLKYLTARRRRNPLVELPDNAAELLNRVTHCLITHCQKGHFDHLDRAGTKWLRERNIPVFCMAGDAAFLAKKGLNVLPLKQQNREQAFLDGTIIPIPCRHGRGIVGSLMAHGYGYFINLPEEPSLYIAGDTILTSAVESCLRNHRPAISVMPAGGARFDVGGDIIMGADDVVKASRISPGIVIANHLEALDHCPVTRNELAKVCDKENQAHKLVIPDDGETLEFSAG
ncbi:MBL fold metallo-hydrolase [Microbulbifer marinus]|uniref:L-ascorbate metabolism protein UlaG, beta-lactamase superfamily n=1 Tax=Microbulbifer marinus TaxID=658218 RepID=A0A1H3W8Z4_9GAMM|nr:MBL fold metallo-hydrolase [Microbulbifer marinus]SDZ83311.1 L-ascorbate metabolism protein UlaG, beta-lactamase superfamily [Microbulbifer marinus]